MADASIVTTPSHRARSRRFGPFAALAQCTRLLVLLLAFLAACSHVQFVSSYDEIIDRGTSDLNTKIVSFVGRMETLSGKPEGSYDANATAYDDVKATLATLGLRARTQEKNEITQAMLKELEGNVERLRQLHEMGRERGLSKAVAEPALQSIEVNVEALLKFEMAKRREQAGASN